MARNLPAMSEPSEGIPQTLLGQWVRDQPGRALYLYPGRAMAFDLDMGGMRTLGNMMVGKLPKLLLKKKEVLLP